MELKVSHRARMLDFHRACLSRGKGVLFVFWWLLCWRLDAQPPDLPFQRAPLHFDHLTLPEGIEGNCVNSMVQDSLGFLWFGTHLGLHRFDGYEFITYRHDPNDSASLGYDYVEWLYLDRQSRLWVGTISGLNRFDPLRQSFEHFYHEPDNPASLSSDAITTINEDTAGFLWVGTFNGLNRMDPATGEVTRFQHDPGDTTSLSHDVVQSVLVDREGTLWVGTGFPFIAPGEGGLNRYDPVTETFNRYQYDPDDPYRLRTNKVRCLFQDRRGNIWVGSAYDGLHRFEPETGRFIYYPNGPDPANGPSQPLLDGKNEILNAVTFIREDRSGHLWIGAYNGGVNRYDPVRRQQMHFQPEQSDPNSLSSDQVWSFLETADGVVWIGSSVGAGQIDYWDPAQSRLPVYLAPETGKIKAAFLAALEDHRGHLWMGISTSVYHYDEQRNLVEVFRHQPGDPQSLLPDIVNILFEDSRGWIWIGKATGLNRYDPMTGAMVSYQYDPADPFSLIGNDVVAIAEDEQGYLWIGTTNGLCRMNTADGKFWHYRQTFMNSRDIALIHTMIPGHGYFWIGSLLGLSRLDPSTGEFENLALGSVKGILPAPGGKLWVGAYPGKLMRIDAESLETEAEYSHDYGLEGTRVLGLLEDRQGRLWMGTTDGISCFDPRKETFENYFPPRQTMNYFIALLADRDGRLYFGNPSGLISFFPDSLERTGLQPRVTLTDIRFGGNPVAGRRQSILDEPVYQSAGLDLTYRQNDFSLSFSAMQFSQTMRIRYRYRLVGYDEDWRSGVVPNVASYTNLDPGSYTFEVKATDPYGNWSDHITSLPIRIIPPWWRTWWAIASFILVGAGLVIFFVYDQLRHRMKKAEARRLQELDDLKTRLYTNITHEFRTPLTVISGMVDQILEQPGKWFREGLGMIKHNNQKVLHLVNQMLDLRKLEAGRMALNPAQGDVLPYLRYLVRSFHATAALQKVTLHFLNEEKEIIMDYDPEKLMNIISNLLSNAIKFTPENGHVYFMTKVQPASETIRKDTGAEEMLELSVRDTGIGISPENLPLIFDRFYQVDDSSTRRQGGTGIGLAIIQELVKLMKGEVLVTSTPGQGATFTLHLPITRRAPLAVTLTEAEIVERAGDYVPPVEGTPAWPDVGERILGENENLPLVLLIDDEPDVLHYLRLLLSKKYRLETAADGREGLRKTLETVPDLIISDVMMPEMDGLQLCEKLKTDSRTSHIPVILLTARTGIEARIKGLQHGADAYLAKPFHQQELLERMHNLLELRHTLRESYLRAAGLTDQHLSPDPAGESPEHAFVARAREVILQHLDDFDFNVKDFCHGLGMSHSQLHRKLTALTGLSANRFIRFVRLQEAKARLLHTEDAITTIAFDTGFSDSDYFSRVFRKEVGVSPTEFREQQGGHERL